VYLYIYIYIYIYIYLYMCVFIYIYIYMYIYIYIYIPFVFPLLCMNRYCDVPNGNRRRRYIHICIYVCIHIYTNTYIYSFIVCAYIYVWCPLPCMIRCSGYNPMVGLTPRGFVDLVYVVCIYREDIVCIYIKRRAPPRSWRSALARPLDICESRPPPKIGNVENLKITSTWV